MPRRHGNTLKANPEPRQSAAWWGINLPHGCGLDADCSTVAAALMARPHQLLNGQCFDRVAQHKPAALEIGFQPHARWQPQSAPAPHVEADDTPAHTVIGTRGQTHTCPRRRPWSPCSSSASLPAPPAPQVLAPPRLAGLAEALFASVCRACVGGAVCGRTSPPSPSSSSPLLEPRYACKWAAAAHAKY